MAVGEWGGGGRNICHCVYMRACLCVRGMAEIAAAHYPHLYLSGCSTSNYCRHVAPNSSPASQVWRPLDIITAFFVPFAAAREPVGRL